MAVQVLQVLQVLQVADEAVRTRQQLQAARRAVPQAAVQQQTVAVARQLPHSTPLSTLRQRQCRPALACIQFTRLRVLVTATVSPVIHIAMRQTAGCRP